MEKNAEEIDSTPKCHLILRINLDHQKVKLTEYFNKNSIHSFKIVECPSDYYKMSLDQEKLWL